MTTSEQAEQEEQEVRDELERWFRDAAARDLDAVMAKIADNAISYEHDAPLQYLGVEAIRGVCKRGFDEMPGDLRWDIPDLEVIVRDDIAITWGLNRMRADGIEMWSRGTRIFRRIEGAWKMIHQHVSFPYDPATGRAVLDSKP